VAKGASRLGTSGGRAWSPVTEEAVAFSDEVLDGDVTNELTQIEQLADLALELTITSTCIDSRDERCHSYCGGIKILRSGRRWQRNSELWENRTWGVIKFTLKSGSYD
jgi:hypothetical protein